LTIINDPLDKGAVFNIVRVDLIKKLEIKELITDPGKYTIANC